MKYNDLGYNCPKGSELHFSEQAWEYECRPCNNRSDDMDEKYKLAVAISHGFIEALIHENGEFSEQTDRIGEAAKRYAVDILNGKTTAAGYSLDRYGHLTEEMFKELEAKVNAAKQGYPNA